MHQATLLYFRPCAQQFTLVGLLDQSETGSRQVNLNNTYILSSQKPSFKCLEHQNTPGSNPIPGLIRRYSSDLASRGPFPHSPTAGVVPCVIWLYSVHHNALHLPLLSLPPLLSQHSGDGEQGQGPSTLHPPSICTHLEKPSGQAGFGGDWRLCRNRLPDLACL